MRADLDKAAQGLEAYFVRQMLKEALPDMGGQEQFGAMLQDALADEIAKGGGFGVSKAMVEQLDPDAALNGATAASSGAPVGLARTAGHHDHAHGGGMASVAPASSSRALKAYGISSGFGPRVHPIDGHRSEHHGIDIPGATGQGVRAAFDGTIVRADPDAGGYGRLVVVDHGNGIESRYAHLSAIDVQPGQRVSRGETIGAVGSTGRSTGPHLHFEIRKDGEPIDPTSRVDPRALVAPTPELR